VFCFLLSVFICVDVELLAATEVFMERFNLPFTAVVSAKVSVQPVFGGLSLVVCLFQQEFVVQENCV